MISHQMYSCPLPKNSEEIVIQSPPELFNYKYLRIVQPFFGDRVLSFKQKLLREKFEEILMEMSIYDPKYPAGTEATISSASGGKHVVKLNKK